MKQFNKFLKFLESTVLIGATMICLFAHADQTILVTDSNPNKLPPCPKPNYSKNNDRERFLGFHNCWAEKVLFSDGVSYIGEFRDGEKNGYGSSIFTNGEKYAGEYKNGKPNGLGIYIYSNGDKYTGSFKDNLFNGEGVLIKKNGVKLSGIWEQDALKTKQEVSVQIAPSQKNTPEIGTITSPGDYLLLNPNNLPNCPKTDSKTWNDCWGRFTPQCGASCSASDGTVKEGEWRNGRLNGYGTFGETRSTKYFGQIKDDIMHGQGTLVSESGKYTGEFKNGKRDGLGKTVTKDGVHEGEYENDRKSGYGIETISKGGVTRDGIWVAGEFQNGSGELLKILKEKNLSYKFKSFSQPSVSKMKLCGGRIEFEALQISYILGKIDEISDSNSVKSCVNSEKTRLKKIEANFEDLASNSELKSSASIALQKATYIKNYINQLSDSTCMWKAIFALDEFRQKQTKKSVEALNSQGLGVLVAFGAYTDSFIDYSNIFTNFFTDEYNTAVISKKINNALAEDTVTFKKRYFSLQDPSVTAARNLNVKNELDKAHRNNQPVDTFFLQFSDSLITNIASHAKLHVPLRIEMITTGMCTSDKDLNVIGY